MIQKHINKKNTLILLFAVNFATIFAQSFGEGKVAFSNFLKRMYTATPFEGVKVIDDYTHQYFISVVSLDKSKYTSPSVMTRVAQVKAQSQANTFFNGSTISSEIIIKTSERKSKISAESTTETLETIKENAYGFTQGLELLVNFNNQDETRMVFIYTKELIKQSKNK